MTDQELLLYARQILLSDVDVVGQLRLKQAHVVILGLGGLGSPVALYLAGAGIGHLTLVDGDQVDITNLHRQIAHDHAAVGRHKVASALERLRAINPWIKIETFAEYVNETNIAALIAGADLVLDCTDRFQTRFLINRFAWAAGIPVVQAAALGLEGQLTTLDPRDSQNPCYQCVVPEVGETEMTCAETGVLGPVVGTMGTLQATEAIGVLLGWPDRMIGRLMRFSAKTMQWQTFKYRKDPACSVCQSPSSS
ncbi:MAG: HesA/MoeB/ThiF family protein [Litorivicinaceae bacterium]|nr:HesA/MoeB/ThiF family protein [Litorivicinaceae bacterium]MDP5328492.1 HesA/MoeB/ThiF family protein [Litorivicinaceae bacterium]MDP5330439.1 HesA/MoeB/ThiF family protein [Litorivicinaceae bacterium]MDP5342081.1 HesA/MoeB/ThiF family protein [Litorivicinaceae bacterium]MDP5343240.1 HesA/MoeB/ThiF family protein [Litorivicinaceae bacterium]